MRKRITFTEPFALRQACFTLVATFAGGARADDLKDPSPVQLKQGIEAKHPADYYRLALKLFQDPATKQEAVFWFYVGQLRYRYYLAANPNLKPDGDPALFASLSEVVGRPINEFAGGKPDLWIGEINHALQWNATHENGFTPKSKRRRAISRFAPDCSRCGTSSRE